MFVNGFCGFGGGPVSCTDNAGNQGVLKISITDSPADADQVKSVNWSQQCRGQPQRSMEIVALL